MKLLETAPLSYVEQYCFESDLGCRFLGRMRNVTEVFVEVLTHERQCQVEVVSPPVRHWDFYSIKASEVVQTASLDSVARRAICTLVGLVPVKCQVWLKLINMSVLRSPGSFIRIIKARALLRTSKWVELSNTYPFLTAEEVMKVSLLSPEKRRLCILGREFRRI